jgi:uncharacterized membrane protein
MHMMGGMGAMMLIGLLVLAIVIGLAVYLAVRAAQATRSESEPTAGEVLQQRLVRGEITSDEYYERESALRDNVGSRRSFARRR